MFTEVLHDGSYYFIHLRMETFTKDTGSMMTKMEMELLHGKMEIGADAQLRIIEGNAGLQIKFPLVPGAFEDLIFARVLNLAHFIGQYQGPQTPFTQRPRTMRAAVKQRIIAAPHIKNPDLMVIDRHKFARTWW